MVSNKIVLVGGGGHCKSILSSLLEIGSYDDIAIVDVEEKIGAVVLGIKINYTESDINKLIQLGYKDIFISIGSIGNPYSRIKIYNTIKALGFNFVNIVDKSACVCKFAKMGKGIYVGKHSIINADSTIKDFCIINNSVTVEHDCYIDEFVHLAPGAIILGGCKVSKNTHIGAGSVLKQNIEVGENTVIGSMSNVTKNISSNCVAYGNPCKEKINGSIYYC